MRQLNFVSKFTRRDSISLDKYFKELSREETLSQKEEVLLTKRYKAGDFEALDQLIKSNLRFVVSVAKQYEGLGLSLEDLISEGNIGLMKAARRFDETRQYKFISYAIYWIRQNILKSLNENSRLVRLPYSQIVQIQKLQEVFSKMEQEYGFEPSVEAVSQEMGLDTKELDFLILQMKKVTSLDIPASDNRMDDTTVGEKIVDEDSTTPETKVAEESLKVELARCLNQLPEREAKVLRFHFGLDGSEPMSFREIGEKMGLGRERTRQLKVQGLKKLRRLARRKSLLALFQ